MELETLCPKNWLGGAILSFYLNHYWLMAFQSCTMYYVDINYVSPPSLPSAEQIDHYRRRCPLISEDGTFNPRPVVFAVHHSAHYFAVVFDYERLHCFVLGSSVSNSGISVGYHNWDNWNGAIIWKAMAHYHGWFEPVVNDVTVVALQWEQVSRTVLPKNIYLSHGSCDPTEWN